jgi:hypothetical protein
MWKQEDKCSQLVGKLNTWTDSDVSDDDVLSWTWLLFWTLSIILGFFKHDTEKRLDPLETDWSRNPPPTNHLMVETRYSINYQITVINYRSSQ